MNISATLTPAIVESLYEDALVLSEEARLVFDLADRRLADDEQQSERRLALSCEALRTITRMMHAMAWLLNQRACFAGEMSEAQLRRHGRLPPPQPEGNGAQLALLDADIRDVIERSRALYARVERIDRAWRAQLPTPPDAVHRLRDQLGRAFG